LTSGVLIGVSSARLTQMNNGNIDYADVDDMRHSINTMSASGGVLVGLAVTMGNGGAGDYDQDGDGYECDGSSGANDCLTHNGNDCDDDPTDDPSDPGDTGDTGDTGLFDAGSLVELPTAAQINIDATEIWYDGIDQDCSGNSSDFDADGDSYDCDYDAANDICLPTVGFDCDDGVDYINPGEPEVCHDALDNDCSGIEDDEDAQGCLIYHRDFDEDGFGLFNDFHCYCDPAKPYEVEGPIAVESDDCDDARNDVYPNALETADRVDNNCDGIKDELTEYYDDDDDGYCEAILEPCTQQAQETPPEGGDCNDSDIDVELDNGGYMKTDQIHPGDGTPEDNENWYDGLDQNCLEDDDYDRDGDGVPCEKVLIDESCDPTPDLVNYTHTPTTAHPIKATVMMTPTTTRSLE
jgi:hypothetical protein